MPNPTSRQILIEAAELIEATYWIQGDEFKTDKNPDGKFIELDYKLTPTTSKHKVEKITGMCSIGAMSVAYARKTGEPVLYFDHLIKDDWQTKRAGLALATTVFDGSLPFGEVGEIIADWNDDKKRTRSIVIKKFKQALESPLLSAKTLWSINWTYFGEELPSEFLDAFTFATKAEAEEELAKIMSYANSNKKSSIRYQELVKFIKSESYGGYTPTLNVYKVSK